MNTQYEYKKCIKCLKLKPFNCFFNRRRSKTGKHPQCKDCLSKKSREYYAKNKKELSAKATLRGKIRALKIRDYLWEYKLKTPCVDCGETNPIVLDFDHVRGVKKFVLTQAARRKFSKAVIDAEIAKCEIRCSNCHRIVTHERREKNAKTKAHK